MLGPPLRHGPPQCRRHGWLGALAGLALLCTALAFIVLFALIREVGATRAMVYAYVSPAIAVAAGVVLLGEPFTPAMVSAFAMILIGSVLATRRGRVPADPTGKNLDTLAPLG
jgi:drug/metabolite transporter (DMT)-like permease